MVKQSSSNRHAQKDIYNSILRKNPIEPGADGRWGRKICGVEQDKEVQALPLLA
jgi:hypothetical protein